MFHVKQLQPAKLELYKELIGCYHHALDLMSAKAVADIDTKLTEAQSYADILEAQLSPDERILDVGSGAGLPGVVLALAFAENPVIWVERRQRRANFLRIVKGQLGLENVSVVHGDVRDMQMPAVRWVCAQAVGSFPLLYCLTRHLHPPVVTLIARRGELSPAELGELERLTGPLHEVETTPLPTHGRLVALRVQGGCVCPSSV